MPSTEVHQSLEVKIPQSTQEKPWVFRRVLSKIGNGMKEVVKTIDRGLSQTPIIGDIYKTGKWVIGWVWHVTEQIPVVGDIMKWLRQGSETIGQKMNFNEPEKTQIKTEESELMKNIGNIRDSVVRDMPESELKRDIVGMYDDILAWNPAAKEKFDAILKKNPKIADLLKEHQAKLAAFKTGKENMSTEQLIQEGQELEEKLVALSVQENVGKREDIKAEEFTEFQKKFSGLPELWKIDTKGQTYKLLQNIYFNREPKPDLQNPLVQDFIQKSINLALTDPENKEEYKRTIEAHQGLTQEKSREIAGLFNFNEIEKINLEKQLNIQERYKRLTAPALPHEYSGPDFGLNKLWSDEMTQLFPLREENPEHKQNLIKMRQMKEYPWVFLGIFQWGGH